MKRSVITTLIIGVAVALVVGALHATKFVAAFENAAAQLALRLRPERQKSSAKNGNTFLFCWLRSALPGSA